MSIKIIFTANEIIAPIYSGAVRCCSAICSDKQSKHSNGHYCPVEKMMKKCSWGICNTDSRYPVRLTGGIKFIPFPKPAANIEKCKRWILSCGTL